MSTPQIRLNPVDPRFADAVLADIKRIRATPAGRALFRRLLEARASVTIDKPVPPTNPPNAWTRLANPDGQAGDTVIAYDPADWPERAALGVPPSDVVLFGRLLDAIALATGAVEPEPFEAGSESGIAAEIEAYLRERAAPSPSLSGPEP